MSAGEAERATLTHKVAMKDALKILNAATEEDDWRTLDWLTRDNALRGIAGSDEFGATPIGELLNDILNDIYANVNDRLPGVAALRAAGLADTNPGA